MYVTIIIKWENTIKLRGTCRDMGRVREEMWGWKWDKFKKKRKTNLENKWIKRKKRSDCWKIK